MMDDPVKEAEGYLIGHAICKVYSWLWDYGITKPVILKDKRVHHYEVGLQLMTDDDPFWRGFGKALIEDDAKDMEALQK